MSASVTSLAAILEQEIAVAEELDRNLAAQKQAIIDWNVESLLERLAAREPWLRLLADLEQQRGAVLSEAGLERTALNLRQLIATLPAGSAAAAQLIQLQGRAREVFVRLQTEERHLSGVMANLLSHVHEALALLSEPKVPLYSENGSGGGPRGTAALLHSRA
jgi:flagellar biosynthesis/type III secretory pathway chaperone